MRNLLSVFFLVTIFGYLGAVSIDKAADDMIEVGIFLNQLKLCPATSGNLSVRLDEELVAVTASGKHKGYLTRDDVVIVDLNGRVKESNKKPSDEARIHTAIYAELKEVGAVLHTHSLNGVVLTRLLSSDHMLVTRGYEIHKVFPGIKTHESYLEIPIFENSQDIESMAVVVSEYLEKHPQTWGFLIRGHGFYTWGVDMNQAKIRLEAFEYLFESELKIRAASR